MQMKARIKRHLTQDLYQLGEDQFEHLCSELHGVQKGIAACDLHGTRGQADLGVDHIAVKLQGDGIEVGQSKCYKDFDENNLQKSVEPFIENIDHWKIQKVKRYILFVACDVRRTQLHEQISSQRKVFKQKGIKFELWSGKTIERNLAPHRAIVEKYIDSKEIVNIICGSISPDVQSFKYRKLELAFEAVSSQRLQLADALSKAKYDQLENFREMYRQGHKLSAFEGLRKLYLEGQQDWSNLAPALCGRILRTFALYNLHINKDFAASKEYIDTARKVDPEGDETIWNIVSTYHREGVKSAFILAETSPTLDATNLQASFLLELGKSEKVLNLFRSLPKTMKPNAESKRLEALAFLLEGDLAKARSLITSAITEKPQWFSLQSAMAVVNYFSAMSPPVLKNHKMIAPFPVSLDLIKRDNESIAYLEKAYDQFALLSVSPELSPEERQGFQLWSLAAVANHPDRQEKASQMCSEALESNPSDPYIIGWVFFRNFEFEKEAVENNLRKSLLANENDVRKIVSLITLKLNSKDYKGAFNILKENKTRFKKAGEFDVWLLHQTHSLLGRGLITNAKRIRKLASTPEVRNDLDLIIEKNSYRKTGAGKALLSHLESLYEKTNNGIYLLEACRLKSESGDFDYIADKADILIEHIQTPAALHLASMSVYNNRQPGKCLKLIDKNSNLFPEGILPADLRNLRVRCLQLLGYLNSSLVEEAKSLVKERGAIDDVLALMDAQLGLGDRIGLKNSAMKLLASKDVFPSALLKATQIMLILDKEIARILWQEAVQQDIKDPELLISAVEMGYALGFDQELRVLNNKLQKLSTEGKFFPKALSFNELLDLQKKWYSHIDTLYKKYESGELPIHLLADPAKISIVKLYYQQIRCGRGKCDIQLPPPLFARHGGRPILDFEKKKVSEWRLHLDITGLLMASSLDILDIIERTFQTIWLPASTQVFLLYEQKILIHPQPSRISNMRKVQELVSSGLAQKMPLSKVDESHEDIGQDSFAKAIGQKKMKILANAKKKRGYLVDYLPLCSHDDDRLLIEIPENYRPFIIGVTQLVDCLHKNGFISNQRFKEVCKELPNYLSGHDDQLPRSGSELFLVSSIPEHLSGLGIFEILCHHFEVYVQSEELDRIERELSTFAQNEKITEWVHDLIGRIQIGLEKGNYEISAMDDELITKTLKAGGAEHPALQSLQDLLSIKSQPNDVVWVDDRTINSHSRMNLGLVIGISDMLNALKTLNRITKSTYYKKLIELRQANVLYIPLTMDEILYHLKRTELHNNQLTETVELSVLRRYWASSLLSRNRLQSPPDPQKPKHELDFILLSRRAIDEALTKCWAGKKDSKLNIAHADWLLLHMYTGLLGIRHFIADPDPNSDRIDLIGMDLGHLLTLPIGLSERSQQNRYLDWISSHIVNRRLEADPEVASAAAALIRQLCTSLLSDSKKLGEKEEHFKYFIREFLLKLPNRILSEMHMDTNFMSNIGLGLFNSLTIGEYSFSIDDYWRAAYNAVNHDRMTIAAYNGNIKYSIERTPDKEGGFIQLNILDEQSKVVSVDSHPLLGALSDDSKLITKTIQRNRYMLDLDSKEVAAVQTKAATQDPVARIKFLHSLQKESYVSYFNNLASKAAARQTFHLSELIPPSPESVLKHFRLTEKDFEETTNFSMVWPIAIGRLIDDEEIVDLLDRIVCVPVSMPDNIIKKLMEIDESVRTEILLDAEKRWSSPVSLVHLINIAMSCSEDDFSRNLAKRAFQKLSHGNEGNPQFQFFHVLLTYLATEFSNWQKMTGLSVPTQLFCLWTHTSRIQNILIDDDVDIAEMIKIFDFKTRSESLNLKLFHKDELYALDVLNPSRISHAHFTLHAVASVLKNHKKKSLYEVGVSGFAKKICEDFFSGKNAYMVGLLRDLKLQNDCLRSLFGGDRATILMPLIGHEMADRFSSASLHRSVKNSILQLKKTPGDPQGWTNLAVRIGYSPLFKDLVSDFLAVVSNLAFVSFYLNDIKAFRLALPIISDQVSSCGDKTLQKYVVDEMINVAEYLNDCMETESESDVKTSSKDILLYLVDNFFVMSLNQRSSRDASLYFSNLAEKLFDISPYLVNQLGGALWQLVTRLPANQLHGIWRLLLIARARSPQKKIH